jgi:transcriptional regulator
VLVLFQGAQAYVSPNWYPSKAQHGKAVPTWNYTTVQAHGRLRAIDDPAWVRELVTRLTLRHEGGRERPWHVTDAPPDFIEATLRAIVGIEIEVTRLEGKFKLSQNRPAEDRAAVVEGLRAEAPDGNQAGAEGVAKAMIEVEQRRADGGAR